MTYVASARAREPRERSAPAERSPSAVNVMLLVSSLEAGGAERQVVELVRSLDRRRFSPLVCSLSDRVPLARHLPDPDRELVIVRKRWTYDATAILRVGRVARAHGISIVHAFLFDAEMVARSLRRAGVVPVMIGSERNSDYALSRFKTACLRGTSGWLDALVANSDAGRRFSIRTFGVEPGRVHVIRNGVDVERFRRADGRAMRASLGVAPRAPLVGMIASFKRQKRHEDFFRAARLVLEQIPEARFVCVGEPLADNQQGAADYHREMRQIVDSLGLAGRIGFPGGQDDMAAVYSACDLTVLPSSREGTPNVLLESMACEVPVVATNVADNAAIVPHGRVGLIVPPGDVNGLAGAIIDLLGNPGRRESMGSAAREWVLQEFSTAALARRTEAIYSAALTGQPAGVPA
jgi:glycosyltransferase involved in cell wall biosynthesis